MFKQKLVLSKNDLSFVENALKFFEMYNIFLNTSINKLLSFLFL